MVKKAVKKSAKKSAKKSNIVKVEVDMDNVIQWHEAVEVNPSSKSELLWLQAQLQRCGVRSIGDLENLIARAE